MTILLDTLKSKDPVAVMMSGGLDSATLIACALKDGMETFALAFDDETYHQQKELVNVTAVLHHYGIISRLNKIRFYNSDSIMVNDSFGYTPGWKMAMQVCAMAHCEHLKVKTLLLGYNIDNIDYKDEHEEYIQKVSDLYNDIYGTEIRVVSPFRGMTKGEVTRLSFELNVPIHLTCSCGEIYPPPGYHCGRCELCKRRKQAFAEIGRKDPAYYME